MPGPFEAELIAGAPGSGRMPGNGHMPDNGADNGRMDTAAGENVRSIYMTFPDEATAARVAGILLEERLIACANILPAVRSIYRWEGRTEDDAEVVAFAKSRQER